MLQYGYLDPIIALIWIPIDSLIVVDARNVPVGDGQNIVHYWCLLLDLVPLHPTCNDRHYCIDSRKLDKTHRFDKPVNGLQPTLMQSHAKALCGHKCLVMQMLGLIPRSIPSNSMGMIMALLRSS